MHIDLYSALRRPAGAVQSSLAGPYGAGATARRVQPLVERVPDVQLGTRPHELTYGPAGPFAELAREVTPAVPDDEPSAEADAPEVPAEADADGGAQADEARADGPVTFGFMQSGRGALAEHRLVFVDAQGGELSLVDWDRAGAGVEAAEWARVDPGRIGLARGDTVVYGALQDLGDGTLMVQFDDLVDSQGQRFSLTMQVNGAPPPAAPGAQDEAPEAVAADEEMAPEEPEEPSPMPDPAAIEVPPPDSAWMQQQLLQQQLLALLPVVTPPEPGADADPSADASEAEPEAETETETEPAPPARAALAAWWADAEAGGPPAPTLDLQA